MWQLILAGLLLGAPATGGLGAPATGGLGPPQTVGLGGEVSVHARAIPLPALPDSLEAARDGRNRVRPALAAAIRDLEGDLERLYQQAAGAPAVIRLGTRATPEILALQGLLTDPDHEALSRPVFDLWNAWQTALLQCGLEDALEGSAVTSRMSLQAFPRFEGETRVLLGGQTEPAAGPPSAGSHPNIEFLSIGRMNYSILSGLGRRARRVAEPRARELAQAWTALAEHLNAQAQVYANLERAASADPALAALRLRAKINFLERFRASLWLCDLVWAHMASQELPAPLADLRVKGPR